MQVVGWQFIQESKGRELFLGLGNGVGNRYAKPSREVFDLQRRVKQTYAAKGILQLSQEEIC